VQHPAKIGEPVLDDEGADIAAIERKHAAVAASINRRRSQNCRDLVLEALPSVHEDAVTGQLRMRGDQSFTQAEGSLNKRSTKRFAIEDRHATGPTLEREVAPRSWATIEARWRRRGGGNG
jgi:hypothetical protein